eukprot:TRINITY_DN58207_c0_g1_i1.p1 TRINITY_DN58207_c0_g1~~TRINITY_DN58207_c0_g1_i1.p1  ORF type:complete len:358 (-),score=43.94 TRINITY_DN58207_c0_g1_i1:113-1147(-)
MVPQKGGCAHSLLGVVFAGTAFWQISWTGYTSDSFSSVSSVLHKPAGEDNKLRRKRQPFSPTTPEERLLWALGCQLWLAGRDMALAGSSVTSGEIAASRPISSEAPSCERSTTSHIPTLLCSGGKSLQDAGNALLDGKWTTAWRQLEATSFSSQEYWPAAGCQGLVDLVFSFAEPVPHFRTWGASDSLEHLAIGLDAALDVIESSGEIQYPWRERAEMLLMSATDTLREARWLFENCKFNLPRDPRGTIHSNHHDYDDDFWDDEDDESEAEEDELGTVNDQLEYSSEDMTATMRIREIQKELIKADRKDGPDGRKKLLSQLIRETHPDQNPGREEQVRPFLNIV